MSFRSTSEPGKLPAGILAILVHAAFFVLLVFGITWRTQSPAPVMVDLWNNLPSQKVTPVEQKTELPPPEPKHEPKPQPKPQPKEEPEPAPKPDIALKEKEEKKKLEEEKRKQELEKKKAEQKKEEERQQQEKLKEQQAKKLAAQKEAQAKAASAQAAASAENAKVSDYIARIAAKIKSNTIVPPEVVGNPQVIYEITLLPTGEILSHRLVKSSGVPSYDAAAERAILKSTPLPVPKDDPVLFQSQFRVRNYVFRPDD